MFKDLLRIIFPDFCIHCGTPLMGDEDHLCTNCLIDIPWALQASTPDNDTELRLAGRVPCQAAASLMIFHKGSVSQSIVHQIKYHGNTKLGTIYGKLLGQELKKSGRFDDIDFIIPVPLHWFKKLHRGYNQSDYISQGISAVLGTPVLNGNLKRIKYTHTQTKKNRIERQKNMQSVFAIKHPEQLQNKHILITDDIITTGATLDACYQAMKSIPGLRISIASLGLVKQN